MPPNVGKIIALMVSATFVGSAAWWATHSVYRKRLYRCSHDLDQALHDRGAQLQQVESLRKQQGRCASRLSAAQKRLVDLEHEREELATEAAKACVTEDEYRSLKNANWQLVQENERLRQLGKAVTTDTCRHLEIHAWATVRPVHLDRREKAPRLSNASYTVVTVAVRNHSTFSKYDYRTWRHGVGPVIRGESAALKDDLGNVYRQIDFGPEELYGSQPEQSIYPGTQIVDLLIFEPPVKAAEFLILDLPGSNVECKDSLTFRVPTKQIVAMGH